MKPETRFRTNRVLPFLKTLKHTARFPIQQMAIHGDPDYMLCVYGFFIGLELKAEGGRPTGLQILKLNEIERCGGIALVAHPGNWEKTKQYLSAMDRGEYIHVKGRAPSTQSGLQVQGFEII